MSEGGSLIDIGELSKPATVLIEKISLAVGGIFRPHQIKRIAKAEAEAAIIHAEAEIAITDLHRRAVHRFIHEEAKKQENIESITSKALPQLEDQSQPQAIDDDWITNFFDKCRLVSDSDMQQLWAKVLAGEANVPGSYSKRTVAFLGSLDKRDALLFQRLCGFGWFVGDIVPLVYNLDDSVYNDREINFGTLTHLDDIGLISFQALTGFMRRGYSKRATLFYYGEPVVVEFENDNDNQLNTGKILLTQTGRQLAPICSARSEPNFLDYVLTNWVRAGLVVSSPFPRLVSRQGAAHSTN
jgi:hypothetical protein